MRLLAGLVLSVALALSGAAAHADPFVKGRPVAPGSSAQQPWVGKGADGEVFADLGDGRIIHDASGFVCETSLAGFTRDRVIVFDASGGGRDVACRFRLEKSWFTLYFTRLPGMDGDDVFETYVRQAEDVARPLGPVESPLKVGNPPLPGYARHWRSGETTVDGLWLVQIGDWFVKLRTTYDTGDEAAIAAAAKAVFESVHAQVEAPEI